MSDELSTKGVNSYGKVYNFDDASVQRQFRDVPVGHYFVIQEKIDGSQFSARVDSDGNLFMRSKGVQVFPENAGMFEAGVQTVQDLHKMGLMKPEWTYRFEYLSKPKHNCLEYGRVPRKHLVLIEVERDDYSHLKPTELWNEALQFGIDAVPIIWEGYKLPTRKHLEKMLDRESILGKVKIEGIVIKAIEDRHDKDGKMLKAKIVCAEFKERQKKDWKKSNPTQKDIVQRLISELAVDARYDKAIQALRERGELTDTVQDIGPLMKHLATDMGDEQAEYVREELFKHFWPQIVRGANGAFPQYYKDHLKEKLLGDEEDESAT